MILLLLFATYFSVSFISFRFISFQLLRQKIKRENSNPQNVIFFFLSPPIDVELLLVSLSQIQYVFGIRFEFQSKSVDFKEKKICDRERRREEEKKITFL